MFVWTGWGVERGGRVLLRRVWATCLQLVPGFTVDVSKPCTYLTLCFTLSSKSKQKTHMAQRRIVSLITQRDSNLKTAGFK